MSERSDERAGAGSFEETGVAPRDLPSLATRLREAARSLPPPVREGALPVADKVHEHAVSQSPDTKSMRVHLESLLHVAELTPLVNALLESISNVGL